MPLDTGEIADGKGIRRPDELAALRPVKIVLSGEGHVGAALREARESLGLAEDDIAQATRVRAAYITAIEAFDLDALPARPFVVGYIRAYARALGLDAEAVVARFHAEAPRVDGKLRPPGGVSHDAFATIRGLLIIGAVIAAAVASWNLWRRLEHPRGPGHAVSGPAAGAPAALSSWVRPDATMAPAQIGEPLPTPPEATTPPVYVTPGLGAAPAADANPSLGATDAAPSSAGTAAATPGAPFVPIGAVYGAPPPGGGIILQARKATSLIVRGAGGAVYFARVLAAGEAWRAPAMAGLTVDVDDPAAVEVFVAGASRGRLTQARMALARLTAP